MRRGGAAAMTLGMLAAVGCDGSKFDLTTFQVFITHPTPTTLSNAFSVALEDEDGSCPLSANATLTIDGATQPFGSCTATSDPFESNPSFMVQAKDGDYQAEATVSGLVPGADAVITSPAGGQVAAGASLTLSIPAPLQGEVAQIAEFTDTGVPGGYAGEDTFATASDAQSVTLPAPAHPASYILWVSTSSGTPGVQTLSGRVVSCSGFARCYAGAVDGLGPLTVDVTP